MDTEFQVNLSTLADAYYEFHCFRIMIQGICSVRLTCSKYIMISIDYFLYHHHSRPDKSGILLGLVQVNVEGLHHLGANGREFLNNLATVCRCKPPSK